jgi:hypothetical protein
MAAVSATPGDAADRRRPQTTADDRRRPQTTAGDRRRPQTTADVGLSDLTVG